MPSPRDALGLNAKTILSITSYQAYAAAASFASVETDEIVFRICEAIW